MKITDQLASTELRIYCITNERIGIHLVYNVPSVIVTRLGWLEIGLPIVIRYGIVKSYDRTNDIFNVIKGDHTSVVKGLENPTTETLTKIMLQNEKLRFEAIMRAEKTYITTSGEEKYTKANSQ